MSSTAPRSEPGPARLVLTPGEPAGIGPDVALALAARGSESAVAHFADPALLAARAEMLGLDVSIVELAAPGDAAVVAPGRCQVVPVHAPAPCRAGRVDPANAGYVLECLDRAVDACRSGAADAMVTGPVNKAAINDAGIAFSGHTEYLAARLDAGLPVMMLAAGSLRVALVTTHVALAAVPGLVTGELIEQVVTIVDAALRQHFGIGEPRIALCGLNPHAGEGGHLGREEIDVVAPAAARLRARGLDVRGPLPADTAFTPAARAASDVVVALYHDQGLAALKALGFGATVNVTLGLPIVRTSVDHGTALELAGSGRADAASLAAAVALAGSLGRTRRG
ncbi:MAG: 4-hydroxythreonine-4-phosphate dehydrogenase PdxA [Gammaproteobacteria bacterium]